MILLAFKPATTFFVKLLSNMQLNYMDSHLKAVLLGGLILFSSCSGESENSNSDFRQTERMGIRVDNDIAGLPGRIKTFAVANRALEPSKGRAYGAGTRALPEPPVPSGAKDMADAAFDPRNPVGTTFVLNKGVKAIMNLNLNDAYWYVKGELTLNTVSGKGRIFVLDGGVLSYPDRMDPEVQIYTYKGGTFKFRGDDFSTAKGSVFHTQESLAVPGFLDVQGVFNVDGKLEAEELYVSDGGMSNVLSGLDVATKTSVSSGMLYVHGSIVSPELEATAGAYLHCGCKGLFGIGFRLAEGSVCVAETYLESPVTELESGAVLSVMSGGLLDLGVLELSDAAIEVYGPDYAVVTARSLKVDRTDLRDVFKGNMGLHYEGAVKGVDDQGKLEFLANVKINSDDDTLLAESACHPGYIPDAPADRVHDVTIEHIAQIDSPKDHEHQLSATGVQQANGKVYVSYHRNGAAYDGCAEVFRFDSETEISLISYMRPTETCDFNHLLVDEGNLFLTGSDRKGGFLAYLPLSADGTCREGEHSMSVIRLQGSDANCAVRSGNYYMVAATDGFHVIDAADKKIAVRKPTSGSAKYICSDGDMIATLNLASRGGEQAEAEIGVYDSADYTFSNPRLLLKDAVVTPIDGKNVCLTDGTNIYVALGGNGIRRYTDGIANGAFRLNGNARANGLDYDDRYIYVAYGEKGLRILDKKTLKEVASYTHSGGKSANFVKAIDGYVFVAYGLNGLQVFRLTGK